MLKLARTIGHWIVMSTATVWLVINAGHILAATFAPPKLMVPLSHLLPGSHWIARLPDRAWPWLSLLLIVVLRQEAHRWFSIRRGRRSADRLLIGWFVFVGTLLAVDWLEPAITMTWPPLAIETSLWLATFCAAMWISRLVHSATRRRLRMIVKRWHVVVFWSAIVSRIAHQERPYQGGPGHVPKAVSPTRRAR